MGAFNWQSQNATYTNVLYFIAEFILLLFSILKIFVEKHKGFTVFCFVLFFIICFSFQFILNSIFLQSRPLVFLGLQIPNYPPNRITDRFRHLLSPSRIFSCIMASFTLFLFIDMVHFRHRMKEVIQNKSEKIKARNLGEVCVLQYLLDIEIHTYTHTYSTHSENPTDSVLHFILHYYKYCNRYIFLSQV